MIRLRVEMGEPLWRVVGQQSIELEMDGERPTLADVLLLLSERPGFQQAYQSGADGEGPQYVLYLNDSVYPTSAATVTHCADGDTLRIILPNAGGIDLSPSPSPTREGG
jgi:sulfur carrier protein ThiS